MKVTKTPSYSPSFGIKVPNGLKDTILSETSAIYGRKHAKKILQKIRSIGTDSISMTRFSLGFSEYSKDNVFLGFVLINNENKVFFVRSCLGKYIKNNFPFSEMNKILSEAKIFFA